MLSPGRELPSGGLIRRLSDSPDDRLRIADMRGALIVRLNCGDDNCRRTISLPRASSPGLIERGRALLGAIFGRPIFASKQDDLNLARSGGLAEAVVELRNDKVDLGNALKPVGRQFLRWRTASPTGRRGEWSEPVIVPVTVVFDGFKPGLYDLELMRSNGTNFEALGSSLLLVADGASFERKNAIFQNALAITGKWSSDVGPETRRRFLQAALEYAAQDPAGKSNGPKKATTKG